MTAESQVAMQPRSGTTPEGTAWTCSGEGPVVVLIHGVGMNKSIWHSQIVALESSYRVLAYDMLGHGDSQLGGNASLGLDSYTGQLVNLLQQLEIAQAHIIGHSMGALVALDFALNHASKCASVVVLNGVYKRTPEQRRAVQQRASEIRDQARAPEVDATISRWFGSPVPEPDVQAADLACRLLKTVPLEGYARAYSVFAGADQSHADRLRQIKSPALIATGEFDPNSTPAMAAAMHKEMTGSQLAVLHGQRHMMSLVAPDEVNQLLLGFLAQATAAQMK